MGRLRAATKVKAICSKDDELCIENDGFCIINDESCIQNDELNTKTKEVWALPICCEFLH